jgi:hypothetical protein
MKLLVVQIILNHLKMTLYQMNGNDIEKTAKYINDYYSKGYYIKVKHIKTGIEIIKHNEPCNIYGALAGTVTQSGFDAKQDSIVIEVLHDQSVFLLSMKDDYQITFQKPKIVISKHDPYGEEDWEYD